MKKRRMSQHIRDVGEDLFWKVIESAFSKIAIEIERAKAKEEERRRGLVTAWAKMKSVTAEAEYKAGGKL